MNDHIYDMWFARDKDFGRWFINMDQGKKRAVFSHYGWPLDPDPIEGTTAQMLAGLDNKDKFEIYCFQTELLSMFFITARNNSLELVRDWGLEEELKASEVELYGNTANWGQFVKWIHINSPEKLKLIVEALVKVPEKESE